MVGVSVVVGPGLVEQAVTARVQSAAVRRGADVTWQSMQLDGAGATLSDVRVEHAAVSARIPALRVEVAPLSVLGGSPRISAVRVVAPEVVVRGDGVRGVLEGGVMGGVVMGGVGSGSCRW